MPEPKTATSKNDALDIQAVVEHLTAANRKVGKDYVDLVEKTVAQVTDLQLETATALKLPVVTNLVETQVDRDASDRRHVRQDRARAAERLAPPPLPSEKRTAASGRPFVCHGAGRRGLP